MNNDNNIPNTNNPTHRFVFTAIGYTDATGNVFDKRERFDNYLFSPNYFLQRLKGNEINAKR